MRMTRAALRAQESLETISAETTTPEQLAAESNTDIFEDSDKENSSSQGSDTKGIEHEEKSRHALRDITAENYPNMASPAVQDEPEEDMAPRRTKGKSKGVKGRKKKATTPVPDLQPALSLALEDPFVESISEETSELKDSKISSDDSQAGVLVDSPKETAENADTVAQSQAQLSVTRPSHPDSEFETSASNEPLADITTIDTHAGLAESAEIMPQTPLKSLDLVTKTPRFDPEIHQSAISEIQKPTGNDEDSFVGSIKTRSPSKLGHHEIEKHTTPKSCSENTVSRPLSKPSSPRVEDSVAALDDLEDALEKVSKELPAIHNLNIESPIKARSSAKKGVTPKKQMETVLSNIISHKKPFTPAAQRTIDTKVQTSRDKLLTKTTVKERVKEFESKPTHTFHRRATSVTLSKKINTPAEMPRIAKHGPTKSVSTISSNTVKPVAQDAISSISKDETKVAKKRVVSSSLSTAKPAFVPAKSTKPVTKSTFVLPGEAIAAKLRAQREERAKREEETAAEAANTKTQFKARPVPARLARPSIMPRENKTSQARTKPRTEANGENKENVAPLASLQNKSTKTTEVPKARVESAKANSSARRATTIAPSTALVNKRSTISTVSAPVHRVVSSTSQTSQIGTGAKGKEVFERHRVIMEAEDKEKKEKEEAAKRARAEAAERGRLASREWAEKQKKKLAEKAAATVGRTADMEVKVAAVTS